MSLLDSRINSVMRRVASLPAEVDKWLRYTEQGKQFEKNSSQLEALDIFMTKVATRLESTKSTISDSMQAKPLDISNLLLEAEEIELELFKAYFIWGYFRSKLEQRFVPEFADSLLVTDLVSHDCYMTTIRNANKLGIEHRLGLRDYPLTYFLQNHPSPLTWPRDVTVQGLAGEILPIPVIGIPWDHMANPWEWLSLNHEVAHALDVDMGAPSKELSIQLGERQGDRAGAWQRWMGEIFADAIAILLAGPAFVSYLATSLTLPEKKASSLSQTGSHPPPYLRVMLNVRLVLDFTPGRMVQNYISGVNSQWEQLYGKSSHELMAYLGDLDSIWTVLNTTLTTLKDKQGILHGLKELIEFNERAFEIQLEGRDQFLAGKEVTKNMPLRHVLGAAYMAVEEHTMSQKGLDQGFANRIATQTIATIKSKAPVGQLPLRAEKSILYLQDLADSFLASQFAGDTND